MRAKFTTRQLYLRNETVRNTLLALVRNLPLDDMEPLEIVVREQIKGRRLDQNARYHAGPLKDIADQAWVQGRQYDMRVWHEMFKRELLPETFDPELCREPYEKWSFDPAGEKILIGSTTELTVKGFAIFMEAVYAWGANLGVQFSASPNER